MNRRLHTSQCVLALLLFTLYILQGCFSSSLPPTEAPLIDGHPFVVIWNAPTERCRELRVPLDTSAFHAVSTPAAVPGQFLTIFYEDRLGLYPKVSGAVAEKQLHGGIPQRGNLTQHLDKALSDIAHYINSHPGLAVIDWEAWRPLWDRNWGSKRIYHKMSIAHAQKKLASSSHSSPENITAAVAKSQFETAGKSFMEKTISLGIDLKPKKRWGFYLFPDCYNHGWREAGYTGRCSETTQRNNDALGWLWEASTALYPSVYLHSSLRNSPNAPLYVQNRIQEAMRVARLPKRLPYTVPVYVYARPLYRDLNKYLSMEDLVNTIGESAALGASGTVLWGASADFNDTATCEALSGYLMANLNRYVANVTAAARLCSHTLCQSNGRCVRKDYESRDYLHLSHRHFDIVKVEGTYLAVGTPSDADRRTLEQRFTCQCYAGRRCSAKLSPATDRVMFIHV